MTPETNEMIKSIIPVLSAFLGTIVGIAGTIIVTFINKKSEERKHLSTLTFNAGIENFKEAINLAIAQKGKASILPLELYIINMMYLSEIIEKGDIGKDKLKKLILEKSQTMEELAAVIIETEKQRTRPNKSLNSDG